MENNSPLDLRNLVHLEASLVTSHQTLLTICPHVVIVVQSMQRINVLLMVTSAANVTRLAILHLYVKALDSTRNARQFTRFRGRGRTPRGFTPR